jgi:hypothetical protein
MKCLNSTFNAQGLRIIIVVVQVGVMKISYIYRKSKCLGNKNWMKLNLSQNWWFSKFHPIKCSFVKITFEY